MEILTIVGEKCPLADAVYSQESIIYRCQKTSLSPFH